MYRGCSRRKDGNLPPPGPPRTVDLYSGKKKKTYLQSKRERRREEGEAEEEDDDEQSAGEEPGGGSPSRADGATAPPRPLIPSHLGGYVASPPRPRPIADGTAAVLSKVSALRLELPLLASETAWRQALRRAAKSAEALASLEVSPEEAALSGAPLAIFEMLQQCLQSGPLRGGKPGYFKRCGPVVASVAAGFIAGLPDPATGLMLSERQRVALARWSKDAEKAAAKGSEHAAPDSADE